MEELPQDTQPKCDMCDVSWPDDAAGRMHRLKKFGIITHQGCAQFAADVLAQHPDISSREQIIGAANLSEVNQPGTFHVTVHRAMDLPGVQLLGTQAPYAKLSLLPWKEPFQTKPSENGGRNPLWKSMHDNVMQLSHMYNSTITPIPLLEVEIWNSNYLSDDMVACTLVDMTPLLRYPLVEARRWFTLSSRVQAPLAMMSQTTGQPKVQLSIKFVPLEGKNTAGNEHKFRVHQLKSIGLAIPNCAVCKCPRSMLACGNIDSESTNEFVFFLGDRVIMNVIKGAWGYRCEYCGIDAHKACIMKAMTKCECKRATPTAEDTSSEKEKLSVTTKTSQSSHIKRNGVAFKALNNDVSRLVGELFVNFQGLHLCTKQCQQEKNFHAKNIFEGDTYCRLLFENAVHETSPVLKSADPMYHEKVCFKSRYRNSVFRIEIIDFNSDTCIGEMSITLFQLMQREADRFVRSDPILNKLREPLRRLSLLDDLKDTDKNNAEQDELLNVHDRDRYVLYAPAANGKSNEKKKIGFALLNVEYAERKEDLLRIRVNEDVLLLERELKDITVDTLRNTVDRFSRVIRIFQWADMEYDNIISWKDKKKSAVCLVCFVLCCVFVNLEYVGAYIMFGILVYMLYQLHLRLEGSFIKRWIGYMDYDAEQIDHLKLHRPLAELRVAVHEANLSEKTDELLLKSQSVLKDLVSAKLSFYVRIKYLPNDKKRSEIGGNTSFIPSGYEETIVAWTHPVEKSQRPVWRNASVFDSTTAHPTASTFASQFVAKQRKECPFRNFNISWRHNPSACECKRCIAYRESPSMTSENVVETSEHASLPHNACGIDHHAFYFPVPQACRKNFTGRDDLAPWRLFPGILQFELCISLNGEAKESPDLIVSSGSIALKDVRTQASSNEEILIPLSTLPSTLTESDGVLVVDNEESSASVRPSIPSKEASEGDLLRVRVEFQVPSRTANSQPKQASLDENIATAIPLLQSRKLKTASRAERSISELVCESLIEKETTAVIGGHFLDAFWKIKDTLRSVQNEIGTACGTVACVENLLNWTHPWKTATAFFVVSIGMIVFSFIPGRWLILVFGISEFGAGFIEDLPPSNHARNILWNFLSSVPTDQDLIDVYEAERELYLKKQRGQKEKEEEELLRLRHHALWTGIVMSKGENERSYKVCIVDGDMGLSSLKHSANFVCVLLVVHKRRRTLWRIVRSASFSGRVSRTPKAARSRTFS